VFLWDSDAVSFGVVRADNFALFINIILCIIGVLTMLFSNEVVEREGLPTGEYYALTLFAISGMMLMASATDLLVVFLALEVLSLSVYVLTGLRRGSSQGAEAAFKYFLPRRLLERVLPLRHRLRVRRLRLDAARRRRQLHRLRRQHDAAVPGRRACSRSASASRCRPCRSTCGPPTPTRERRPWSRRVHVHRGEGGGLRRVRARVPVGARAAAGAVDSDPRRHRRADDGRRRRSVGVLQNNSQAHARVFEHRATAGYLLLGNRRGQLGGAALPCSSTC
jgi:hypothetical protein